MYSCFLCLVLWEQSQCLWSNLIYALNFFLLCGRVVCNLRVGQSSASAITQIVQRCLGWNLNNLDPITWFLKELFSATNKAIRLYDFNTFTQPQEFYNKAWAQPLVQTRVLSAYDREVPIFRIMRKKSPTICNPRVADRLSPHHVSQFSAFSTEVLVWSKPGHNRSSSPFTTLADRAERRVVSTGAGQPNY